MLMTLNCPELDIYHKECEELLQNFDYLDFMTSYTTLLEHTQKHFAHEEHLMKTLNFRGFSEHYEEHQKILGEMSQFLAMANRGNVFLAKNYVKNTLSERFDLHVRNIDSQLAMFLKTQV